MAWQVNHGGGHDDELSLLSQLRLVVGYDLGPVTLVGGVAANAYVATEHDGRTLTFRGTADLADDDTPGDGARVRVWPTAFAGVRVAP
jgi:hypothetical protein